MAKLIVIEGHDKAGKFTQSNMLKDRLLTVLPWGYPFSEDWTNVALVEVPVVGPWYKTIYKMLKNGLAKKWPNIFQFVQFLNKFHFQLFRLPKLMRENDFIVLDRWSLSGLIYGDATGVNSTFNRILFARMQKPDITFVMNGDSFKRSTTDDSYEKDSDLQTRVKVDYANAGRNYDKHVLISNQGTPEEVHQRIWTELEKADIICEATYQSNEKEYMRTR